MTTPTLPTPGQEDRCAKGEHADRIYALSAGADSLSALWCSACGRVALSRLKLGTTSSEWEEAEVCAGAGQKGLGL